ncbi:MAG TPA: SAM-dependent methyltransferase [Chloroflexi bacterium]|nr:SAM-dependent methyltransferase [Chloroflexota bacterium]
MNLAEFYALLSPQGQDVLIAALEIQPREKDFLTHFQNLSRRFPREIARPAVETAILRLEAASKFPQAQKMYFTREALEQASSVEVSSYRARRYEGFEQIADLGCSIGGDTLSLAALAPTLGFDLDPLRLAMARQNLQALGFPAHFVQTDLVSSFPCIKHPATALFFDPARRANGRRIASVRKYIPPLQIVTEWQTDFPSIGVKISPGVDLAELADFEAEIEFISLRGELKEAVLWFGLLKTGERRATVLPGPHTLVEANPLMQPAAVISEPKSYFYEPDPAIIRAGMVRALGNQLEAAQVDEEIAYLTADQKVETPFARVWAVADWFPFQLKNLRAYLRERKINRVTVKKRGSPITPEDLIQALRLPKDGTDERVVFLTQLSGNPIVVICHPEEK